MFMKTIYDVYYSRKRDGLISDPWPPIERNVVKMVLLSIFNHVDAEEAPKTQHHTGVEYDDTEEN